MSEVVRAALAAVVEGQTLSVALTKADYTGGPAPG